MNEFVVLCLIGGECGEVDGEFEVFVGGDVFC